MYSDRQRGEMLFWSIFSWNINTLFSTSFISRLVRLWKQPTQYQNKNSEKYSRELIWGSTFEGYSLNWILPPFEKGYKLYAINGTQQAKEVPTGNDYLFITNKEGEIQSWKKFHSSLIPIDKGKPGGKHFHSHLKKEPFISATDICTFKLYQNQIGLTSFGVYSPALSTYFIYQLETNSIKISKDLDDM